jgi:hypothetical protein
MTVIKSYTNIPQSKKLTEILPIESADMTRCGSETVIMTNYTLAKKEFSVCSEITITPCWSLAALLDVLSEIKPQVYTPILFLSEGKWILQFAEYGHGNVCEVTCDNPVDACYEMILKLHELNLL